MSRATVEEHPISDRLRWLCRQIGISRMSRESGVHRTILERFASGQRSLSLGSADKVARVLGLELAVRPPEPSENSA
jgi:hypothetical protein